MSPPSITVSLGGAVTLTNAPVTSGSGIEVVACGLTEQRRRRDTEQSPYIDGEAEIQSVRDAATYGLVGRLVGSSWSNTDALLANVVAVATQESWTLTETIGGVTKTYTCDAADWSSPLEVDLIVSNRRVITLTIPCKES